MGPIEIVVIIVAAAILLAVTGLTIWRKVKGKGGGCGCDCSHCAGCTSCSHDKTPKKKK